MQQGSASITCEVIAAPPGRTSLADVTTVGDQPSAPPSAALLRQWRRRRGLSQLALAGAAGVSARHLSFVETGRSRPSRAMLLRLSEHLDVPLRDRNALLLAAGLAPAYPERRLADPPMAAVADAVARILAAYEPCPALVVDRHWELVDANAAVARAHRRVRSRAARAAVQRAAAVPAPRRPRPAHPARWARGARTCSPACATRSPRPATRGCRSCSTSCAPTPPRRPSPPAARRAGRAGPAARPRRRRAGVPLHDDAVRHPRRRHRRRAGDRGVPARRRRHGRRAWAPASGPASRAGTA